MPCPHATAALMVTFIPSAPVPPEPQSMVECRQDVIHMPRYQAHRPNAAFPCKRPVSRSLRFWRSIALRRGLDNGLSREGSLIGPRDGADAASCSAVRGMRYFLRVFLIFLAPAACPPPR